MSAGATHTRPTPLRWGLAAVAVTAVAAAQDVAVAASGLSDVGRFARASAGVNGLGALGLALAMSAAVALTVGPLSGLAARTGGRWVLRGLATAVVFVPLYALNRNLLRAAMEVVIAPGVTQTLPSPLPPALGLAGLLLGAAILVHVAERTCRPGRIGAFASLLAGVTALSLGWLNAEVLPYLYPRQHVTCSLVAAFLLLLAVGRLLAFVDRRALPRQRGLVATAVMVLLLVGGLRVEASAAELPPDVALRLKYRAVNAVAVLRLFDRLSDWDGDGVGAFFAGGDCAPGDAGIGPGVREIPGDGVDQNCLAGDVDPRQVEALRTVLSGGRAEEPGERARSVLVITLESVRADIALPAIEAALQGRCSRFANAYAARPSTPTSMLAMFQSRFPLPPFDETTASAPTLAELLREAGWETAAFVFSPNVLRNLSVSAELGPRRGFDVLGLAEVPPTAEAERTASADTVDEALAWLADRSAPDRPFLLWTHLFNPHAPYVSHSGAANATAAARYAEEVAYTDREAARLIHALAEVPDLAIVVTSDHGEAFGEHNTVHHNSTVYEEQIRVPLWVCPARAPVVGPPASLVDIAPTILDLLDQPRPASFLGRSLLIPERGPTPVFSMVEFPWGPVRSVIMGRWKLIAHRQDNVVALFDLAEDPGELVDVSASHPDVRDDLLRLLDAWTVAAE